MEAVQSVTYLKEIRQCQPQGDDSTHTADMVNGAGTIPVATDHVSSQLLSHARLSVFVRNLDGEELTLLEPE